MAPISQEGNPPANGRKSSLEDGGRLQARGNSRGHKRAVDHYEAYTYALRVAYLAYLLQPRARRTQHVPAPQQAIQRSSSSINDLMKDFSLIRDSKSTRFPHGFAAELEKRLTGVIMGKEKRPEYLDPVVKRTFGQFYNAFMEQSFRRRMEKDRRVEDLVLIFFSSATKELQKGKAPGDDTWKLMVDRHVALFVRLLSSTLKDHDWVRDRPELSTRLATLESKLLKHDSDLVSNTQTAGHTVEVLVPLSYEVKDMPLVQVVARIFSLTNEQVQADINKNKNTWTENAALKDLKTYQNYLNFNTKKTLTSDDFDVEEAYEAWKKAEIPDLSQMMLAILQSNPELAKSAPGGALPQFNPAARNISSNDAAYLEISKNLSNTSEDGTSYIIDQPVDLSGLSISDNADRTSEEAHPFVFIAPDPRLHYRYILQQALTYDLQDKTIEFSDANALKLLSKASSELLNEICLRWRIPNFSRLILFLDVIREKFVNQEIDTETLYAAFVFVKEHPQDAKSSAVMASAFDSSRWTITDFALYRHILSAVHDALLRELYAALQKCYETKPPSIALLMALLEDHIYEDPHFTKRQQDLDDFSQALKDSLRDRALETYHSLVDKIIPADTEQWEFYHIIELAKAVMKLADKIQRRYRKSPEIMDVNPLMVLVAAVLPAYAQEARSFVATVLELSQVKGVEVPIEDGFTLYRELVAIRRTHHEALPEVPFAFHIEGLLADFVWRWIRSTDERILDWVEQAIKHDRFTVRVSDPEQEPTNEERHSTSIMDVFRSFKQSIDQIIQLNWDDDLQYAKFMTAIARTAGTGIARYCEIVEKMFSAEMDRPSPQQTVVPTKTRQEKWMQLAKEAWSNKERMEPFQFYPESFVKLNNIEWATYQLDNLEKEVNVDACAEVIRRNTPPVTQRERKAKNYVFTIKIVEAEDLRACDLNGLSDPYVVLGDEYQKRLAKTRIIYGDLNPRWDESVDIATQGPLNIIATVWDWDALGDHDTVGRTSIKLDPAHFSDFMPREYWLDLDTQGRLLLRVSMEGERDDIEFYFGKAFRTLKRTERDMTRKITDKLTAYIHHCLSRNALKSLLSKGISISAVSNYFSRNRPQSTFQGVTDADIERAIEPLYTYFWDNFAIMKQTLTDSALVMVMTRIWKEVLVTIEGLLVPPLSDKPSRQPQLTQQELDVVFKWLKLLFDFFHQNGEGVPADVLKSPKYHDIQSLNFFYFDSTESLIRESERMASAAVARQQAQRNRLSAPASLAGSASAFGGILGLPSVRRSKTILMSRNLGTMRKAKEEKRREAQMEPNDDMILRILRMRPEAERYLKDRSRQKERLAAAAAAEMIVRQSLASGGGRMAANLPRR